ncbi:terminase large subunit [Brevundimonas phage vB_BpoS-Bambus]|nr:terminase large subunit [Brevundimonas phage vB_BpoS-Bambus]
MSDYIIADRIKARQATKQLHSLAAEAKRAAERGLILPENTRQGIIKITGVQEVNQQIDALMGLGDELQKRHLERLLPLARDDFNAFCEYVSPDEPPESKWHIYLTELLQKIENDPELDRFILNCPPGHAKPLHVSTPVLMGSGAYKPLGEIEVGEEVVTHAGRRRKVEAVHVQGELPLLKITTEKGRTIWSAPDHPFLVDGDWIEAQNLRPRMNLSVVGMTSHTPEKPEDTSGQPKDVFALAAFIAAFGSYTDATAPNGTPYQNLQMWFSSLAHVEEAERVLDALGIRYARRWVPANKRHLIRLRSKTTRPYQELLGMTKRAGERRVPEFVFRGDDEKIKHFLTTYFRLRGETPKKYSQATLIAWIKSADFAQDLQKLLARYDVDAVVEHPQANRRAALVVRGPAIERLLDAGISFHGRHEPDFIAKRLPYGSKVTDKVAMVEAAGVGECRCLTVFGDHTFTADGVVVHNSTYASRLFVAWRLGRNPKLKIIGGGHSQRFVENEFSKKIRSLVGGQEFRRVFPEVVVDYATRAADQWAIAGYGGQYVAKGTGQAVHGFRANFACVDDPYAKIEEAESAAAREKVNTWFVGDIGSRMLPFGKMFLIMTRFHEHDLTGHLMEMNPRLPAYAQWTQVEAPALCIDEDTDVLGRKLGDVLWDYYDLSFFKTKKTEWSYQRFALVYQQNATATSDDSIAGRFQYYERPPHLTEEALKKQRAEGHVDEHGKAIPNKRAHFRRIVLSVDCAAKVNQRADYTVVQTWGETNDRQYYLLRQTRKKVEFDAMIEMIEQQAVKDGVDVILVEDKGQGTAYIQNRGQTTSHRRLAPAPIVGIDPKGQSKEFRFDEVSPLITAGDVFLPKKAEWMDAFTKEVGQFPEGAHDDQVDAMTQALQWMKGSRTRFGSRKIGSFG